MSYRDLIGLKPGDMFSDRWAEFDLGNATIGLGNGERIGILPSSQFSDTFEVDDLSSIRDALLAKNVPVTEINETSSTVTVVC